MKSFSLHVIIFDKWSVSVFEFMTSNLDVSIGYTERWVGCCQRKCKENTQSVPPTQCCSVSQILMSEFDIMSALVYTYLRTLL